MTSHTIYLRFKNRAEAYDALRAAGLLALDPDGVEQPILDSHSHSIAIRGELVRPGVYDDDGAELEPPVPLSGYHIDWATAYGPLPEALQPFQVKPHDPLFGY